MVDIDWLEGSVPVSTRFDDPYFSKEDGRAETSHVFIAGNHLHKRWPKMATCTIAELGFGTGLNFLETVRQWNELKPNAASLHYISFEQFPIETQDMQRALDQWTETSDYSEKLIRVWENRRSEIEFDDGIRLTLHIGDANELLPKQKFAANAWYLDGFSPAKNPELWNEALMKQVARCTVAGGTFSTYTSAGRVRRALQSAGFEVNKTKGFGRKREMLTGTRSSDIHVAK